MPDELLSLALGGMVPPRIQRGSMQTTIKVDSKGRVSIPKRVREQAGLQPGDTLFLAIDQESGTVQLRKVTNPFDGLALHAIAEYEAGRTRSLDEIMDEMGIGPEDEPEQ